MKLFIANWKMKLSLQEQLGYVQQNLEALTNIENKIILCPSFPALLTIAHMLKDTEVAVGAQTCSEFENGSYTGQVAAKTITQAGCSYIIVGHSEERSMGVSNEQVAQKTLRVLEAGAIPVVCIGESKEAHEANNTQHVLSAQLAPIKKVIGNNPIYIAYEPLWAIGTGNTPTLEQLNSTFDALKKEMPGCAFLYGGSVNADNIKELNTVNHVCGFLVGGASLQFEEFKKVVS